MMPVPGSFYQLARSRMVQKQLIDRGVCDQRVLDAMRKVPRHLFVEETLRSRAYHDGALPIGEAQTLSQAYIVAYMSEMLALTGSERVLEIGTGSGYQTAILAELAMRVFSIERIASFASKAGALLESLSYRNVVIRTADGTYGWKDEAPFDAILVAAGSPEVPAPLVEQLKIGGRMIIPVGEMASQTLYKVTREETEVTAEPLLSCIFVPLQGAFGWKEDLA
jgi:protein-L-isoaspartate(D-aspartate) O-methyltransferase